MEKSLNRNQPNNLKLLSLSTAEQGCSLAVVDGLELICEEYWLDRQTHSKRILGMVKHMLEHRAKMSIDDIDAFVVAKGPGSFTGLRIGISVIKGLAYGLGKPAIGVSSLDGIAFQYTYASIPVCVMMDARRNEVYSALYQFENGVLRSKTIEEVASPEQVAEKYAGQALYVGSGSNVYRELIEQKAASPVFGVNFSDFVSARHLIQALDVKTKNALRFSTQIVAPAYIRKSDAELQFIRKDH